MLPTCRPVRRASPRHLTEEARQTRREVPAPALALSDYDFDLPDALIARAPLERRDASRLLVLDRASGAIAHRSFREWPGLLRRGDLVVLNDTRVIPARLLGRKQGAAGGWSCCWSAPTPRSTPPARCTGPAEALDWVCLGQASKGLRAGTAVELDGGSATVVEARGRASSGCASGPRAPSPTCSSARAGAAAALHARASPTARGPRALPDGLRPAPPARSPRPTAGLHFTAATARRARQAAAWSAPSSPCTSGPGTFLPVRGEDELDRTGCTPSATSVPEATAAAVDRARGRRAAAWSRSGTTVVAHARGAPRRGRAGVRARAGARALFIRPATASGWSTRCSPTSTSRARRC